MAVLFTYPLKSTLSPNDLALISNSEDGNKTNNATMTSIKDVIDVVDSITATYPIVASSLTGGVNISSKPYSGGNNVGHVPIGGTNSTFLKGDGTWGSSSIPLATDGARGGIQIGYISNAKNYPVELGVSEKAFVNVPWTDTTQLTLTTNGTSGAASWNGSTLNIPKITTNIVLSTQGSTGPATWNGTTLNIPQYVASSGAVSSITATPGSYQGVSYVSISNLSSAVGNVNLGFVGLTATNFGGTTPNPGSVDCRLLIKDNYWASLWPAQTNFIGGIALSSATVQTVAPNAVSSTASKTYSVQLDANNKAVVNVPWTDRKSVV